MYFHKTNYSNIIRVDEVNTFPSNIEEIVLEKLPSLRNCLDRISEDYNPNTRIKCAFDWRTVINDTSINELNEKIKEVLKETYFEGFHNTRVLHKDSIVTKGLRLLLSDDYFTDLSATLSELGIPYHVQLDVCKELKNYLSNEHGYRTGLLALFSPFSRREEYKKFVRNIGGEICEFALKNKFPRVYSSLTNNGYPITVRVAFSFKSVSKFEKDKIILEIIRHYIAKMLYRYYYPVAVDTIVVEPISPLGIIEILDYMDGY